MSRATDRAYVTGSKSSGGYCLVMSSALPARTWQAFRFCHAQGFAEYRPAQDLANLINAHARKVTK